LSKNSFSARCKGIRHIGTSRAPFLGVMSKSHVSGSHSSGQQKAAELENLGAHAHNVAEYSDNSEHLKPHEQTRNAEEHGHRPEATGAHGVHTFGHKEISALAHKLWQGRGCPEGSAEEDWNQAIKQLRSR
jgi:hypothetical protein